MAGKNVNENVNDPDTLQTDVDEGGANSAAPAPDKGMGDKTPPERSSGDSSGPVGDKIADTVDNVDAPVPTDEPDVDTDTTENSEWPEYEDANMTAITNIFKDKGVAVAVADGIFAKAIESGDIADIDVETLEQSVGKDAATLIMASVQTVYNENFAASKAIIKKAHDMFGGEDGWKSTVEWAQVKAESDPEFKSTLETYTEMINTGGIQADMALKAIKETYMDDPTTTNKPDLVRGDGSGGTRVEPITNKVEFVNALKEAYKDGDMHKVAQLRQRRAKGRELERKNAPSVW